MREEKLNVEGVVTEVIGNRKYRVELENSHILVAEIPAGYRRQNALILPGDRVVIEMTPFDLQRGTIVLVKKK